MLVKQLKLLNKCTKYCSVHIYWMLTKFYKFYLYIYKDIKHLVRKNQKLHNNVFLIVKFNRHACKAVK
jgi:predicted permease